MAEHFGGTAGNIAYGLRLFDIPVSVVASVGHDFQAYDRWLRRCRVDLRFVRHVQASPTAVATILTDQDDNQITGFLPGALRQPASDADLRDALRLRPSLLILAPANTATTLKLGAAARHFGLRYLFDPGQQTPTFSKPAFASMIRGASIFISNDYELALTLQRLGWSARRFLQTVPVVVTTLGPRGVQVIDHGKALRIPPARPATVSDPTGAGDAFRAGFVAGLLRGLPLALSARLGAVAAVYTVERLGTQTHSFTIAGIRRRYFQNYRHPVPL